MRGEILESLLSHLSFHGRANRPRYWVANITLAVFYFLGIVAMLAARAITPAFGLLVVPVLVALLFAGLAISARRLHDRAKSAWWLLLFWITPAALSLFAYLGFAGGGSKEVANFISFLRVPLSVWAFVELGCLKGTIGPNRYGDDPLQPAAEVFA